MPSSRPYDPENVGGRIRLLRTTHGLLQTKFGEAVGQPPGAVSNWERGLQRPGIPTAEKMCQIYGVTLDWIFLGRMDTLQHAVALALKEQVGGVSISGQHESQ